MYSAASNSVYILYATTIEDSVRFDTFSVSRVDLDSFTIVATQNVSKQTADLAVSQDGSEVLVAGLNAGTLVLDGTTLKMKNLIHTGLTTSVVVAPN